MARRHSFGFWLVYSLVVEVAIFGGLLFGAAGTLRWPRAWGILGIVVVATAATLFAVRRHPDLIEERAKPPIQRGQPAADRVLTLLIVIEFFAFLALVPLDVFRWRLLPPVPGLVTAVGFALFALGWTIIALALRENAFAALVVRSQEERRQVVVDTGVYRLVRHPMYAGDLPLMVGLALALGSWTFALLSVIPLATFVARIGVEERLLRGTLAGYEEYARRVRWRLVPFVW